MSSLFTKALVQPPAPNRTQVIVRDSEGRLHLDWPKNRVAELLVDQAATTWIDIYDRDSDFAQVEKFLTETFKFHPLAIDDALQETHNPKLDDWDDYLYIVLHAVEFDNHNYEIQTLELDIFLGPNYLVTYHTAPIPSLDRLRGLLERDGGKRLSLGPDHLLYVLLDLSVSDLMPIIEELDDTIDTTQDEILERADPSLVVQIMKIKRAVTRLHRILIPEREIANRLARDEFKQIDPRDRIYFRDVYDHLVRLHDISETMRDLIASCLDTHLSAVSNRTNNVMKTLTTVSMLFLPLNFVVGFFGMNFFGSNIEIGELNVPHGLLFGLIVIMMLAAPWAMWFYSRWRGWF